MLHELGNHDADGKEIEEDRDEPPEDDDTEEDEDDTNMQARKLPLQLPRLTALS